VLQESRWNPCQLLHAPLLWDLLYKLYIYHIMNWSKLGIFRIQESTDKSNHDDAVISSNTPQNAIRDMAKVLLDWICSQVRKNYWCLSDWKNIPHRLVWTCEVYERSIIIPSLFISLTYSWPKGVKPQSSPGAATVEAAMEDVATIGYCNISRAEFIKLAN
jgi:hypothetical protein